jgi:hypothetical protein
VTQSDDAPGFLSHHVSLSHPDGLLADSGSRFLAAFVLARCSVPPDAATVRTSQNLVVHVVFSVSRVGHGAFLADVLPVPRKAAHRRLRRASSSETGPASGASPNRR